MTEGGPSTQFNSLLGSTVDARDPRHDIQIGPACGVEKTRLLSHIQRGAGELLVFGRVDHNWESKRSLVAHRRFSLLAESMGLLSTIVYSIERQSERYRLFLAEWSRMT